MSRHSRTCFNNAAARSPQNPEMSRHSQTSSKQLAARKVRNQTTPRTIRTPLRATRSLPRTARSIPHTTPIFPRMSRGPLRTVRGRLHMAGGLLRSTGGKVGLNPATAAADTTGIRKGPTMSNHRNDVFPRQDTQILPWINQFMDRCSDWWSRHGGDGNLDELRGLRDAFAAALEADAAAQAAARAATAAKNQARAEMENSLRAMVRLVQNTPDTTNAERADMGLTQRRYPAAPLKSITPPLTAATSGRPAPVPAPRTAPAVTAAPAARLVHRLRLTDPHRPDKRGKPPGAAAAEIRVALVPAGAAPPTDPERFAYLLSTTRPSFRTTFGPDDVGKTAVYLTRWVNTRGEVGPWSEVTAATVAA
ncbi:MAG: hypothetical protein LW650_00780 [Planctomycetaceae bacterium]|jgi:hypothetical protein|nr:hypothetical protein [Planctomycetaceae bacterium]